MLLEYKCSLWVITATLRILNKPISRIVNNNSNSSSLTGHRALTMLYLPLPKTLITGKIIQRGPIKITRVRYFIINANLCIISRFTTSTTNSNATSNRNKVGRVRERSPRERRNDEEEIERKRRREERIREREKKEDRSPSRPRRSKSPRPRRRARVVPRYMVQIPKIALDL